MQPCPSCSTPTKSPYCSKCGAQLPDSADLPTDLIESTSIPSRDRGGRFTAGTMLAGRYRIVGKLYMSTSPAPVKPKPASIS